MSSNHGNSSELRANTRTRKKAMKTKPKVNAFKHRLSDAKWRRNINNCFNALNAIVAPNGRQTKSGKLASLSRIETLRSTQTYIENAEKQISQLLLLNPLKISDQTNDFCNNIQHLKQMFDLMEFKCFADDIKHSNTNALQSDFNDINSNNKLNNIITNYREDNNNNGNKNLDKTASYYNEMTKEWSHYTDLNACHHYYCYDTYSVHINDQQQHKSSNFNYLITKKDSKHYRLASDLENNSSLTNVDHEQHCDTVLDQMSSTGSHFTDQIADQICCLPLTPKNRKLRRNDPMNRKVKPIRFAPESRPTKCRKKLNLDETDNNLWPGLMNLMIHSGGGDQTHANLVKQESQSDCETNDKMNNVLPPLSKDLEDIKLTAICSDKSQIDECLLSLDSKEDFIFGHNLTLSAKQTDISTDCDKRKDVINTEIDEKEILDFINSEGKYGIFGAIMQNELSNDSTATDSLNCVSQGISTAVNDETSNDSFNRFDVNLGELNATPDDDSDDDVDNFGWSISSNFTDAILDDNTQFEEFAKQEF